MADYVNIGPCPANEGCAQVGRDDYPERSRRECGAFLRQLRRALGHEPDGARLRVKSFEHDFGTYREVVVEYDPEKPGALAYAIRAEDEAPGGWDSEAKRELGL